ncbi:uncharacterized protein SYNPCC7002_A1628-like [Penaeus japonicus]|uniref:uncharacterized protein SYNPCC7002_A1628-like n=1 Tax=Penaeus japonicus TaxID=27405 RepID=UPI001C7169E0|nr:uncharacterized protein SYNPCC7002_A1628-like [Penaeus japonicus]
MRYAASSKTVSALMQKQWRERRKSGSPPQPSFKRCTCFYLKLQDIFFFSSQEYLPATIDDFHPDVILYDAGVDPHERDELGKLKLTDQGLYNRDMFVLKTAICRGIPIITVIGGGYDEIMALSARHSIIHRVATEVWDNYL